MYYAMQLRQKTDGGQGVVGTLMHRVEQVSIRRNGSRKSSTLKGSQVDLVRIAEFLLPGISTIRTLAEGALIKINDDVVGFQERHETNCKPLPKELAHVRVYLRNFWFLFPITHIKILF
jgi:hypothetical protein